MRQLRNMCGPAALATVLNYWGISVTPEEIAAEAFSSSMQATHLFALALYSSKAGLRASTYSGSIRDLKEKVSAGMPVLVLQMSSQEIPSPHYRVVIGYDDTLGSLIVLDPEKKGMCAIPYVSFRRLWRSCRRWTLLVVPPNEPVPFPRRSALSLP